MPDSQPRQPDDHAADATRSPESSVLTLCGARLTDGRIVDVRLGGSRIEAVGTAGSLVAPGARVDLRGHLLLPAPAEPHAHCDTALTADGAGPDAPGPASQHPDDVQRRATEAALLQLGHGATALRSHVRIGDIQGLGGLEAVLQARRSLRGLADLTAVAVPRLLTGVAGGRQSGDAPRRAEDGGRRGRRLPRAGSGPDGVRGGRPGGRRRARLPRRPAHGR